MTVAAQIICYSVAYGENADTKIADHNERLRVRVASAADSAP